MFGISGVVTLPALVHASNVFVLRGTAWCLQCKATVHSYNSLDDHPLSLMSKGPETDEDTLCKVLPFTLTNHSHLS